MDFLHPHHPHVSNRLEAVWSYSGASINYPKEGYARVKWSVLSNFHTGPNCQRGMAQNCHWRWRKHQKTMLISWLFDFLLRQLQLASKTFAWRRPKVTKGMSPSHFVRLWPCLVISISRWPKPTRNEGFNMFQSSMLWLSKLFKKKSLWIKVGWLSWKIRWKIPHLLMISPANKKTLKFIDVPQLFKTSIFIDDFPMVFPAPRLQFTFGRSEASGRR